MAAVFTITFLLAAGAATAAPASGESAQREAFASAALSYERGEYGNAISVYSKLIGEGLEDGPLYFNAGNCYLQEGSIGNAIFFYELARRFMPRDADLLLNLRYARSLMKQSDTVRSGHFIVKALANAFNGFTLGEAFLLLNLFYFASAAVFLISLFVKRHIHALRVFALMFACVAAASMIPLREKISREEKTGIVVSAMTNARLEPFEDASSKFPLYEGMSVQVLKTAQQWYKVKRPDGKVGWVPKESLLYRFPPRPAK
jgi:tetratricopeptide (TPR) repeat protein